MDGALIVLILLLALLMVPLVMGVIGSQITLGKGRGGASAFSLAFS